MKLSRYMGAFAIVFVLSLFVNLASYADSSYDMKYFRFLSSERSEETKPSDVTETGKKWSTAENQKAGDYFIIDMYSVKSVGKLVITQPANEYPGRYNVYITSKMEDFGEAVIKGAEGTDGDTLSINFPAVLSGRFIKIELASGTEERNAPWGIQSIAVFRANDESARVKSREAYFVEDRESAELYRELLLNLGIDTSEFDGTRASFAKILTQLTGRSNFSKADGNIYTDVKADTKYAREIESLYPAIEDNIKFRPYDDISLDEALKLILNAMGYHDYAAIYGGYPTGCRSVASNLKLLTGIDQDYLGKLDEEALIKLLYNTLSAKLISKPAIGSGDEEYEVAMYYWHGVYEVKGNLVSTGTTSRSGAPLVSKDLVMIGDDTFFDYDGSADEFIGMNVTAYVYERKGDIPRLVYIMRTKQKNKVLVIPSDNIDSATGTQLTYYSNPDKRQTKRTVHFETNSDMIYNGLGNVSFDSEKLMPENGGLTLIDSNNNGQYDLVVVEEYINYYLGYKDNNNKQFSDLYYNPNITLNEDTEYKIIYNGKEIAFEDIPEKSIISVMADKTKIENGCRVVDTDKATVYTLKIAHETMTGVCDNVNEADGIVKIDGIEQKINSVYLNARAKGLGVKLQVGKAYRFYMDFNNDIAAAEEVPDEGKAYGLLVKTIFEDLGGGDYKFRIKLLTTTGEFETFELPEQRLKIDGTAVTPTMELLKQLFWADVKKEVLDESTSEMVTVTKNQLIPQVIGYTLDSSNIISAIDTKKFAEAKEDKNSSLGYIPVERYTCNVYRGMVYPTENKSVAPNMTIGNVVLFIGPADIEGVDIENEYSITSYRYFKQDGKYDMEIFKRSEYNDLEYAFIHSGATADTDNNDYILVDKVNLGLTKEGDVKTEIKGVRGSGKFDAFVYSDTILKQGGLYENGKCILKRGDLIATKLNARGEITSINRLIDVADKSIKLKNNGKYYNLERVTLGQIYKNDGESVMVTSTKPVTDSAVEDRLELFLFPTNAIVYDEESNEVRKATLADIKAYSKIHDEIKTSRVYICTSWGLNVSFVIYNFSN